MGASSQLQEVARELRRLLDTSPTETSQLPAWYEQSRILASRLNSDFAAVDLPEEVWHFLHDADTRLKDPEFGLTQSTMSRAIVGDLESGIIPEPRGSHVSVDFRWLIVAGASVAAVAFAWFAL